METSRSNESMADGIKSRETEGSRLRDLIGDKHTYVYFSYYRDSAFKNKTKENIVQQKKDCS
jgi:hypothetical protein